MQFRIVYTFQAFFRRILQSPKINMFKFTLLALVSCVVYANAGVITPLVSSHSVSSHGSIQSHPSPLVHAVHTVPVVKTLPVVHAAPVVPVAHVAPVLPIVKTGALVHAPIVAVHH